MTLADECAIGDIEAVMADVNEVVAFLKRQQAKYSKVYPFGEGAFVLSFVGTTSAPGRFATMSLHRLDAVERGRTERELRITLQGGLGRRPVRDDCITVSMANYPKFIGYQAKTPALLMEQFMGQLFETPASGRIVVNASHVFTVHHTPNVVRMFESVPLDEVTSTVNGVPFAIAGVGPMVNISPRLVQAFHVDDAGQLSLMHGDGYANKTYLNLQQNAAVSRVVVDVEELSGYVLDGHCEEITESDAPEAWARTLEGYLRLGFGPPSRVYRQIVTGIRPLAVA